MNLQELFKTVLNMSLTGSVVILFVLLARLALKKAPKVFSYALWAVVLFRLLCPVSISSAISLLNFTRAEVSDPERIVSSVAYTPMLDVYMEEADISVKTDEAPVVHTPDPAVFPENGTVITPTPDAVSQQAAAEPVREPIHYAVIIWLAGIGVMLVFNVISYWRLHRKLVGAVRLRRNIYLADHIPSAFVMGVFRPKIYLPSMLDPSERGYIIAHERCHIRRKDHIIKLLAYAALCIHWFNPLVWIAFTLSGKDMEMSCDEAVVRKLGPKIRADYSASLLRLATGHRIIAGTPLAFGEGDTKGRVLNMAKWKKPKFWVVVCAAVICIGVVAACAVNPASKDTQAEATEPTVLEMAAPGWITGVEPEEACRRAIEELKNAESYYILYEYDDESGTGGIEYRRCGNDQLSQYLDATQVMSNIYFDGVYGSFLGDYWVWEDEPSDRDPNSWLERWSPEGKEISGGQVNGNTITYDAVWYSQIDPAFQYQGTFTYTFNADGSLAAVKREYKAAASGETDTEINDRIIILEEAPEDTYAAIKAVADQCIPGRQLEQIRYEAKLVSEVPSNKTEFDKNFELGAGTMRWYYFGEQWQFAFGAEDASAIGATLIHQEASDGQKSLVAEAGYWLEVLEDGKWKYVDESITLAAAPEESIDVSWSRSDSYEINWQDDYGQLAPGFYRIGRNYTAALDSGESETHVCYAKFRVYDKGMTAALKKCEDALNALLSSDSYHVYVTNWISGSADESEDNYLPYYITTEVWKSGDDYLNETRYVNRKDENVLEGRRGSLMRGGLTYGLEWSGSNVRSPLSDWSANTYMGLTNFTIWTYEFQWFDSQVESVVSDGNSVSILEAYDFDGRYDNIRITLTFDDGGDLTGMECAYLAGVDGDPSKMEVVVDTTMKVVDTSAAENAQVINSQDVSKPLEFSYREDQKANPGAKTSGFVNTKAAAVGSMADAVALADKECTLEPQDTLSDERYNITRTAYDETAKMWRVEFTYSADDGVYQAVYLNDEGITQMIVTK